jgi:hypothetical protein
MSDSRAFGAGDERLGRVLRDAVEARGRPVTASLTGAGIGSRAFVAALERAPERRPAGDRPRFGAIVVTAILGGAVATALALWPALSAHPAPAVPRTAVVAVAASPAAATLPATPTSAPAVPAAAAIAGPAQADAQPPPAPPAAGASHPPAAQAPAPATAENRASAPASAAPVPTPTPAPLPALTFANHDVVDCCLALGGRWHDLAQGGQPGFRGPSAWTASHAATATWNLGSPTGGQRWDSVRVLVWIPNRHARARVRYTITATSGGERTLRTFDVTEQGHAGWLTIPGTFSAGTPAVRTGTITVRMAFLRPFTAADMAAGQAMFEWS